MRSGITCLYHITLFKLMETFQNITGLDFFKDSRDSCCIKHTTSVSQTAWCSLLAEYCLQSKKGRFLQYYEKLVSSKTIYYLLASHEWTLFNPSCSWFQFEKFSRRGWGLLLHNKIWSQNYQLYCSIVWGGDTPFVLTSLQPSWRIPTLSAPGSPLIAKEEVGSEEVPCKDCSSFFPC